MFGKSTQTRQELLLCSEFPTAYVLHYSTEKPKGSVSDEEAHTGLVKLLLHKHCGCEISISQCYLNLCFTCISVMFLGYLTYAVSQCSKLTGACSYEGYFRLADRNGKFLTLHEGQQTSTHLQKWGFLMTRSFNVFVFHSFIVLKTVVFALLT